MNLYLLMIGIFSLIGIKIFIKKNNEDYLSIDESKCIKGIFVLIVFYSHLATYFTPILKYDSLMLTFRNLLGQLMVVPFLFYSGYGVFESIKKKKEKYINSIPKKRILKTWLNFALAVTLFLILSFVLNKNYSLLKIGLSYVGWLSLGNSNWYIFCIIILYLLTYLSFKILDDNKKALILNFVLSVFFVLVLSEFKADHWFNTALCYNFGMIYSYKKDAINKVLFDYKKFYLVLPITAFAFLAFRHHIITYWDYEILSMLFMAVIVLLTVKVKLNSPILKWFGDNIFFVYILQRLPMIYFATTGLINHVYLYALVCFICTIVLSFVFGKVSNKAFGFLNKQKG